jgi:hypothetical protein
VAKFLLAKFLLAKFLLANFCWQIFAGKLLLANICWHLGTAFHKLISGAYLFILLELPGEELKRQTKLDKTKDVEDAIKYLKNIFWLYANSNRYNYSAEQFESAVFLARHFNSKFWQNYPLKG